MLSFISRIKTILKLRSCCTSQQTKTQTWAAPFSFIMSINFPLDLYTSIHRIKFGRLPKFMNLMSFFKIFTIGWTLSRAGNTFFSSSRLCKINSGNCFCQDSSTSSNNKMKIVKTCWLGSSYDLDMEPKIKFISK